MMVNAGIEELKKAMMARNGGLFKMMSLTAILSVMLFPICTMLETWCVNFDLVMNTHQNLIVFIVGLGVVLSIIIDFLSEQKLV